MKPDWSYAPKWALCCAMDRDGGWRWYEAVPVPNPVTKVWDLEVDSGRADDVPVEHLMHDEEWMFSLEAKR